MFKVSSANITETVAPTVEPVSLAEMKVHCRVDYGDHDTILSMMITAVRQWLEKEYQLSLVRRTYRADLWDFHSEIKLPRGPLASLSSVKYLSTDSPEVLTTLSGVYLADTGRDVIYIDPNYTGSLPSSSNRHDGVQITYVAGYAPLGSPEDYAGNVPAAIKSALKLQVADLFENRETNTQLRMQKLDTTDRLMAPWRVY